MIRPVNETPTNLEAPAYDSVVIGIGSILMQDDGIGPCMAETLLETGDLGCPVIDGGTGGVTLIDIMSRHPRVIIIDAIEMGREPGYVARIDEDRLADFSHTRLSSGHEMGFEQVLQIFRAAGFTSEVILIGIQPSSVRPGRELSPALAAKQETIYNQVRETIQRILSDTITKEESRGSLSRNS